MKFQKSFKLALNILLHSKLRSWLTIIGIVIGVAAIVAIVSIGDGAQVSVQQRLGGLGADLVTVSPGFQRAGGFNFGGGGGNRNTVITNNLTSRDVQTIKTVNGILFVNGVVTGREETNFLAETATLNIEGVDPLAWTNMETTSLDSGRFLEPSDAGVVVLGNSIGTTTFKQPLSVNRQITIGGKIFKIVGVLQTSGGLGGGGDDNRIFMTLADARNLLNQTGADKFDSITFKVADVNTVNDVVNETDQRLMVQRHVTTRKKDYTITSEQATQARIQSITSTFTLFLTAIAAVSLIVGAVGIANTMFTSVLEKTREIGIMKAIGAKNYDIMMIFLLNSALVGLVGGLIGIALGATISGLLPNLLGRLPGLGGGGGVTTVIPIGLLIEAVVVSVLIGMIAGAIPAYRASKLKPVDALRYE